MDGGGSITPGDVPEDPDGHADDAESSGRGWLPPEDRLWRHPSEIADHGLPRSPLPLFDIDGDHRHQRRVRRPSLLAAVAGVATVATAAAVALVVVDTSGTGTGRSTAAPTDAVTIATSSAGSSPVVSRNVEQLVRTLRPSLVDLVAADGSQVHMTGVVLPGGALVVTAASAVAGVTKVDVVTADGKRHRGEVVGSDARSGVAVVSTDGGLTPATFADEPIGPGDFALVACLCASRSPEATSQLAGPDAAMSTITHVGASVALDDSTSLVDAIEAEVPLGRGAWGGVLVDGHGQVLGVLDAVTTGSGTDPVGAFVPAPLAQGVADELAQTRHVAHGWLGVVCSNTERSGATVTRVMPGSPAAAAGLRAGDVVVAVGPHAVASLAELQERLYTVPPGQSVQLSVARGSTTHTSAVAMTVTLATSPGT